MHPGPRGFWMPDPWGTRNCRRNSRGPSVSRLQVRRQLSAGATLRLPERWGSDLILCSQPAGLIAASARPRVNAAEPRSLKVSSGVREAPERAEAAASSQRPPGWVSLAHPRRPLLGDRGRHAQQRSARLLPTRGWSVSSLYSHPTPFDHLLKIGR